MGWSLDYQNLKYPDQLNKFLLAVGKALYLANAFEYKCQYVLRLGKLVKHIKEGKDFDAALTLTNKMKDKVLGPTLSELGRFPEFNEKDIALLDRAREARNFIAHKGAFISLGTGSKYLQEHLNKLKKEVIALVPGDNLISVWIYEIQEKEAAPSGIQKAYPKWVEKWVFGDYEGPQSFLDKETMG